jgi:tetratricopeptide (TPR) repeat protein
VSAGDQFRSLITLGVRPDASPEEVKAAYRRLARQWHPDRAADERGRIRSEAKLREINQAYEVWKSAQAIRRPPVKQSPEPEPTTPIYDTTEWVRSAAQEAAGGTAQEDTNLHDRAVNLHLEGADHYKAARWREAVSCFMQSVCLVQDNPEAYRLLGSAYLHLGLRAKAASAYQQAVRMEPHSADARYGLGEVLLRLGDVQGAAQEAGRLEELDAELAALLKQSISRVSSKG